MAIIAWSGQTEVRNQTLPRSPIWMQRRSPWAVLHCFPGTLSWSWTRSRAIGIELTHTWDAFSCSAVLSVQHHTTALASSCLPSFLPSLFPFLPLSLLYFLSFLSFMYLFIYFLSLMYLFICSLTVYFRFIVDDCYFILFPILTY